MRSPPRFKPEERFHRLHKLKLKWTLGLSARLDQLLNESDQEILTVVASQGLDETLHRISYNLSNFCMQFHSFLQTIDLLLRAAFDSWVRSHINHRLQDLDYDAKVNRLASYYDFPLYTKIQSQVELRSQVLHHLKVDLGKVTERLPAREAPKNFDDSSI